MVKRASWIVVLSLVMTVAGAAVPAAADPGHQEFQWVLLGHDGHPNVATAANGDVIEMTGEGTLSIHPKTVTGGGEFTHITSDGDTFEGDYVAVELLSFNSYGDGTPQGLPPELFGGLAIIRVQLFPDGTDLVLEGNLQIDCLLGKPPAGAKEGIRLSVPGINFNTEGPGDTVFIAED